MDIEQLTADLQSILSETQTAVSLGDLKVRESISTGYFVKYNEHSVCKHDSLSDIIKAWTTLRTDRTPTSVNGWEQAEKSDYIREYTTEYEDLSATIAETNGTFTVSLPQKRESEKEVSFFSSAELYLYIHLYASSPFDAEYTYLLHSTLTQKLQEITGVGPKLAQRFIAKEVTTWKDVQDNMHIVSSQHRSQAKEEVSQKIDSDESLTDNERLQELSSKAVVDNL